MILDKNPIISIASGGVGLGQTMVDYGMPIVQALIAVGSLVVIILTIILQFRRLKQK